MCDQAGDCVVLNVLSPRDLVSRPDNMDETVLHTRKIKSMQRPGTEAIRPTSSKKRMNTHKVKHN